MVRANHARPTLPQTARPTFTFFRRGAPVFRRRNTVSSSAFADTLFPQRFHQVTALPMMDHEKDEDSDDVVDEEWQAGICDAMMDDFTDVRSKEKAFFKQWNRIVRAQAIRSDSLLKDILDKFVRAKAKWIMANGLRNTFATFLIHLWMQCLLQRRDLERLLVAVDSVPTGGDVAQ